MAAHEVEKLREKGGEREMKETSKHREYMKKYHAKKRAEKLKKEGKK